MCDRPRSRGAGMNTVWIGRVLPLQRRLSFREMEVEGREMRTRQMISKSVAGDGYHPCRILIASHYQSPTLALYTIVSPKRTAAASVVNPNGGSS
jgi:hypothetical protein